jgi:hypothetical protein
MASGGSPRARVASYKVSWPNYEGRESCDDADMCKAYSAAIDDGVDVLSVSMGGEVPDMAYMYQGSYKSTFEAVTNGIVVVKAAGNTGPHPSSLTNCEPWVITVAASTTDRDFFCDVTLGDNRVLKVSYIKTNINSYLAFNLLVVGSCVSVIMQHVRNHVS